MNTFLENTLNTVTQYEQRLRNLYLEKDYDNKTVVSIGAAVSITLFTGYLYRKLTVPPKKLRHFPAVTYLDLIKSAITGETVYEQRKRLVLPILNQANGCYVCPTHLGWQLRSTNPIVNKAHYTDIELFPKAENMFGENGTLVGKFIGGDNVGTLEGDDWKRHRKVVNPAFRQALPIHTFGELSQRTFRLLEKIGLENVTAVEVCERMTLDAIALAGFGFDFECSLLENSPWLEGYDTIRSNMTKIFFILFQVFDAQLKWMFPTRVDAHKKLDALLGKIDNMITEKREKILREIETPEYQEKASTEKDLLTLMIEAEYAGEGTLSNEELKRNIAGFFFAGNDTTAVSLAFAIGQLARNPEMQRKAREEVISILGDEPTDVLPTLEDLKKMKYLDACIKETLRLNSPLSNTLPRVSANDMEIDGVIIPKGTYIDADVTSTHLSPKNWGEDSFEFVPERYLDGKDPTSGKNGVIWLPFGFGSHHCLGFNFSIYEQRVFMSMLLRKFEWELTSDSIHKDGLIGDGYGAVRPLDLRVNFRKRY